MQDISKAFALEVAVQRGHDDDLALVGHLFGERNHVGEELTFVNSDHGKTVQCARLGKNKRGWGGEEE